MRRRDDSRGACIQAVTRDELRTVVDQQFHEKRESLRERRQAFLQVASELLNCQIMLTL